jgi:hypothetical protein
MAGVLGKYTALLALDFLGQFIFSKLNVESVTSLRLALNAL